MLRRQHHQPFEAILTPLYVSTSKDVRSNRIDSFCLAQLTWLVVAAQKNFNYCRGKDDDNQHTHGTDGVYVK